ncbi:MAG: DUF5106 domain-containing protein, partial [Sphingobacterium sp.]
EEDFSTDSLATDSIDAAIPKEEIMNYWRGFNFNDTALVKSPQIGEKKFVDFLEMLPTVSDSLAKQAINIHLKVAEENVTSLKYYIKQYAHYLYDPNSPSRNELYYAPILEYLIAYPKTSETNRVRYQMILELVRQNMPGTAANDFTFRDSNGSISSLYDIETEYKLLFFYDPTCHICEDKIRDLSNSKSANDLIERNQLTVLAVSVHPDQDLWESDQKSIPENWINGFDFKGEIIGKGLYNVLAFPTILLLDKSNTVLLKDAPLDVTLRHLFRQTEHD